MQIPARLSEALAERYRIERELGAGGMATVYLAHDVKHDRDVAIKVLHPDLGAALGSERFLAEIRTTAKLQHPHILPLLDSGDADGLLYFVMPVVTGETLRAYLKRVQQLPIAEAVRIAREVAGALDYAHRHNVVHRDIKPENILLHDGSALVADFGIALAVQSAGSQRMTQTGLSLGTPQYMSPEQAMGEKSIDARSDVYALGAVTYEMLTGDAPFTGSTVQAIVAKVMTERPTPIHTVRDTVPPHVEAAVLTALAKLPADRFATASQFADALAGSGPAHAHSVAVAEQRFARMSRRTTGLVMAILGIVAIAATVVAVLPRGATSSRHTARYALAFPEGQELIASAGLRGLRLAWSPDGESFAYIGPGQGAAQLWLRRLNELEAVAIAGTAGATNPSFSPDGREIAYLLLNPFTLKVVTLAGGQSRTVRADSVSGGGVAWATDGYLYVDGGSGLARVRPDGTGYEIVLPLDTARAENGISWPTVLPDGRGLLMRVRRIGDATSDFRIIAFDPRNRAKKELVTGVFARCSPTGHLLWVTADGALHAQRFDLERLELRGEPRTLWSGLNIAAFGATSLALSDAGDLLYVPGVASTGFAALTWVTRDGAKSPADTTPVEGLVSGMALSPDGSSVALEIQRRIWLKRFGGPAQLVTSEARSSRAPTWMPGSRELLYAREYGAEIYRRRADGSGGAELVWRGPGGAISRMALHPDGKTMVVDGEASVSGRYALYTMRLDSSSATKPLFPSSAGESTPAFSRDGKWLSYVSSESGRPEVYVRPFPNADAMKVQVSIEGGTSPRWNPSGNELFYRSVKGDMMGARFSASARFTVTSVNRLFTPVSTPGSGGVFLYEVSPDGQRFLMLDFISGRARSTGERVVLVHNFADELRQRLP